MATPPITPLERQILAAIVTTIDALIRPKKGKVVSPETREAAENGVLDYRPAAWLGHELEVAERKRVSRAVASLERRGLLELIRGDRRVVRVRVTDRGRSSAEVDALMRMYDEDQAAAVAAALAPIEESHEERMSCTSGVPKGLGKKAPSRKDPGPSTPATPPPEPEQPALECHACGCKHIERFQSAWGRDVLQCRHCGRRIKNAAAQRRAMANQ